MKRQQLLSATKVMENSNHSFPQGTRYIEQGIKSQS